MASSRVAGQTGSNSGSTASPTFTMAANPTAGDLLLVMVHAGNLTLTAANGFTKLTESIQGTSGKGAIFWKVLTSGDAASATVTPAAVSPSGNWILMYEQWTNPLGWPANPVLSENGQSVASTTAYTTPTLSPTAGVADCVVIAGYGAATTTRTWSAESFSGTNVTSTTAEIAEITGKTASSAIITTTSGNYSGAATLSVATAGWSNIAIFQPNAASAALPPAARRYLQAVQRAASW